MADPAIATRAEILGWLSEVARRGHVLAMRLLLEELLHDESAQTAGASVIDELTAKRKASTFVG